MGTSLCFVEPKRAKAQANKMAIYSVFVEGVCNITAKLDCIQSAHTVQLHSRYSKTNGTKK